MKKNAIERVVTLIQKVADICADEGLSTRKLAAELNEKYLSSTNKTTHASIACWLRREYKPSGEQALALLEFISDRENKKPK